MMVHDIPVGVAIFFGALVALLVLVLAEILRAQRELREHIKDLSGQVHTVARKAQVSFTELSNQYCKMHGEQSNVQWSDVKSDRRSGSDRRHDAGSRPDFPSNDPQDQVEDWTINSNVRGNLK